MEIKKELKVLSSISNKIMTKKKISKINKIKDLKERRDLFMHSIKRELELKILDFRKEIRKLKKKKKDVFFIKIKVNLLKLKINYFTISYSKKDFKKVLKLIKQIERDLKNV